MIVRQLQEIGQNRGLFGDAPPRRRRVREDEGAAELTRSAAGNPRTDSEAYQDRKELLDGYDRSLRAGDEESADEYHEALKAHHRLHGAAVDARPSAESREWADRLLGRRQSPSALRRLQEVRRALLGV